MFSKRIFMYYLLTLVSIGVYVRVCVGGGGGRVLEQSD